MELDLIDKKILYELGKNSKLSYKQIARNINSKKEVVAYRINNLIKKKIITKFVPIFSLSKLGIFSHKIYLRLQGLNKEAEKKMYSFLINNKKVVWVAKSVGRWDLLLGFYAKNLLEFSKTKQEIISKFSKYIKDYDITFIEDGLIFNRDYLVNKSVGYRKEFVYGGEFKKIDLSEKERKIIQLIKNDARFKTLDIADKLKLDPRTIIHILKKLEKRGILQGNTVFLDLKKIDFQLHKLCIYLQNYSNENINGLTDYLKQNPNTIHLIKSLGSWEFEIEIESDNLNDIYDYINNLKNTFPKTIKQIDLVTITEELKLEFFPEKLD